MQCKDCKGYGYQIMYKGNGFPNLVRCDRCEGTNVVKDAAEIVQEPEVLEALDMLPCPFCGKPGDLLIWNGMVVDMDQFMPGCTGEHSLDFIGTKRECVEFWNQRNH